jgi:hypothetical protein
LISIRSNVNAAIRITILGVALAASGCKQLPDRQFARIGDSLKLTIAKVARSGSGTSVEFVFTVTNVGPRAVNACLGPSRSVLYQTSTERSSRSGVGFNSVDHPGCGREFTLEHGRDMTWSEVLEVPDLSEAPMDVEVDVEVVNPRRCDGWGCTSANIRSNKQRIP